MGGNQSMEGRPQENTDTVKWIFYYRPYIKNRMIQLKPFHASGSKSDVGVHFSIAWVKPKSAISQMQFEEVDKQIRRYLDEHNWKITFTPVKACENCTYGYFEPAFEELLTQLRLRYNLCTDKQLPLDDPKHADVKKLVADGKIPTPLWAHISHSRSDNLAFNVYLQKSTHPIELTIQCKD